MWTISDCPQCAEARKVLDDKRDSISSLVVHDVDTMEDGFILKKTLYKMNAQIMYPVLYVNGKHIGSTDTLMKLENSGELNRLLQKTYPSKWTVSASAPSLNSRRH